MCTPTTSWTPAPSLRTPPIGAAAGRSASTMRAGARRSGDGGRVSVWADGTMALDGGVSARGGPAGGSGGWIEASGLGGVSYGGLADAGARLGKSGTLLLDPKN